MNLPHRLFAALLLACSAALPAGATARAAAPKDDKETKRAEKLLAKLRRLDEAAAADERTHQAAVKKLYPGLFKDAARLAEGDLKTDLTTAVFLHEAAYASRRAARPLASCDALLRDSYRRLCQHQTGGTRATFLRAAALLHTTWAAATLAARRGANDPATLSALEEVRAARALDTRLAARALGALKRVAAETSAHPSLYDYETRGDVARVPFEQFARDLSGALAEVDPVLAELPRGPLQRTLRNARHALASGAARWADATRAGAQTVDARALASRAPRKLSVSDARAAGYAAVCDWRQAARALREAESLIEGRNAAPRLR